MQGSKGSIPWYIEAVRDGSSCLKAATRRARACFSQRLDAPSAAVSTRCRLLQVERVSVQYPEELSRLAVQSQAVKSCCLIGAGVDVELAARLKVFFLPHSPRLRARQASTDS